MLAVEDELRRLTLVDLTPEQLAALCRSGETLYVERKEREPEEGYGPTAAAFGNRLGGWLLIGVNDKGDVIGCQDVDPSRVELQDWLRHKLREEVDPLPPFAAEWRELEGKTIGVVRVAESADTPHVVKDTGSIYLREPGGKRPIAPVGDQRTLLELARRGEDARRRAEERRDTLPDMRKALEPLAGLVEAMEKRPIELIALAAPLTVPTNFSDRVLSERMREACEKQLFDLFREAPAVRPGITSRVFARGFSIEAIRRGSGDGTSAAVDAGGLVAARRAEPPGNLSITDLEDDVFPKLIRAVAETLLRADALGRSLCDLSITGANQRWLCRGLTGGGKLQHPGLLHIGGELTVPIDEADVGELAAAWVRELARAAGEWKPEPHDD